MFDLMYDPDQPTYSFPLHIQALVFLLRPETHHHLGLISLLAVCFWVIDALFAANIMTLPELATVIAETLANKINARLLMRLKK